MCTSILPLEYHEAPVDTLALPQGSSPAMDEPPASVDIGVPEEEVERRIQIARDTAVAEADQRVRVEREHATRSAQEKVTEVLKKFAEERAEYFRGVESEVVQLALAIARKIIQREAEMDPTLLTALVRIALDRMQCGSMVRIRVAAEDAEVWRSYGEANGDSMRWEIIPDETVDSNGCIVETELGTADFGFEAQLRDVEESFAQLLAHRPATESRHAAGF
jgi:flagellar assembly protein FliH